MLDELSDYIISSFDYSDIPIINFFEGNKKNEEQNPPSNSNDRNVSSILLGEAPSIEIQNDTEKKIKKVLFIVEKKIKKNRGRVSSKKSRKIHEGKAPYNLEKLLRRHLFNFFINFGNDSINSYFGISGKIYKKHFKAIDSQSKIKKLKKSLGNLLFSEIFSLKISKKNKGKITDESTNKEQLNRFLQYDELNEFFKQKCSEIIERYYNKNKEESNNIFEFKTLKINLSDKTKTFYNLLEKDKYRIIKNQLLDILKKVYL